MALAKLPELRASGCLHDTFEIIKAEMECGAANSILTFYEDVMNNCIQESTGDLIRDLRAAL